MIKYFMMGIIIVGLAVVIFAHGPGSIRGDRGMGMHRGSMHGQWWNSPGVVEEMGLTKDQIAKLDAIHTNHRTAVEGIKADVENKSKELNELLDQDNLDERALLSTSDYLISARAELHRSAIKMFIEMRKILTPEQSKQLKEFHEKMPFHHCGERIRERQHQFAPSAPTPPPQPPNTQQ